MTPPLTRGWGIFMSKSLILMITLICFEFAVITALVRMYLGWFCMA